MKFDVEDKKVRIEDSDGWNLESENQNYFQVDYWYNDGGGGGGGDNHNGGDGGKFKVGKHNWYVI